MKKIFFTCFSAILLAVAVSSQGLSNTEKTPLLIMLENNSFPLKPNPTISERSLLLNEVTAKAIRNFNREYKNAVDAKWYRITHEANGIDGFRVVFTNDQAKSIAMYDKKGNYYCGFRSYFEDVLSQAIRHRVKTVYYDFDIRYTTEVNMNDKTTYIVTLEDKTSWKVISVVDGGEMVVVKEFPKS